MKEERLHFNGLSNSLLDMENSDITVLLNVLKSQLTLYKTPAKTFQQKE
jgi:hypothetical protein